MNEIGTAYDKWCDRPWQQKPQEMVEMLARCPSVIARALAQTLESLPAEDRLRLAVARWRVAAGRQVTEADRVKVEAIRAQLPLARAQVRRDISKRQRAARGDLLADVEQRVKPAAESALGRIIVSEPAEWVHERFFGPIRLLTTCDVGVRNAQLTWRQLAYRDDVPILPECHFFAAVGLSGTARIDCLLPDSDDDLAAVIRALTWTVPFFEEYTSSEPPRSV